MLPEMSSMSWAGLGSCTPLALLDHASHKDLTNKTNCIATTKRMSLLFVTIKGG